MRNLILAGLPYRTLASRDRSFEEKLRARYATWSVEIIWSVRKARLDECRAELLEAVGLIDSASKDCAPDGLHILAFHSDIDSRHIFRELIRPYHRLRFLDTSMLQFWGASTFMELLDEIVEFEDAWHTQIRPSSHDHPLLLPEKLFETTVSFSRIWQRALNPRTLADVADISDLIGAFESDRRKQNYFEDRHDNRFEFDAERHGRQQGKTDWKYAFRMDDGFHYDVQAAPGASRLTIGGKTFSRYVNAYPYGFLRGSEL